VREVVERTGKLDAGEPAPSDYEREERTAMGRIRLAVGPFNISMTWLRMRIASSRLLKPKANFSMFAIAK